MKRLWILVTLAVIVVLTLGGCMTYFGSGSGKLAYGEVSGASQGQIEIEKSFMFIIHPDLIVLNGGKGWENIDQVLEPALVAKGANAVRDLKLGYGANTVDMLLSIVVPVVSWGRYTIEGEAIKQ